MRMWTWMEWIASFKFSMGFGVKASRTSQPALPTVARCVTRGSKVLLLLFMLQASCYHVGACALASRSSFTSTA